jgi:ATP-binding cassette, subfamily C (CFTR/MRP), member 1
MQSLGCFARIEVYFLKSPAASNASLSTVSLPLSQPGDMELGPLSASEKSNAALVSFKNADIGWSSGTDIVLHRLNLDIFESITMIIGPVGSGKSTLLESVLGETNLRNGSMTLGLCTRHVAYCSQKPWIVNDTIRFNIIGGLEFNQEWYNYTIWVCALGKDLKTIPSGDLCKAESNGVALSGGQKQRVVGFPTGHTKIRNIIVYPC